MRGVPVPVYICGREVLENCPLGPTGATAFFIAMLSYNGKLDMGLTTDPAAVGDPELLIGCLEDSFADLIRAGA